MMHTNVGQLLTQKSTLMWNGVSHGTVDNWDNLTVSRFEFVKFSGWLNYMHALWLGGNQ